MDSGAKWASFVVGVALLVLAAFSIARDWLDGGALSLGLPVTFTLIGAAAIGVGLSRAPLDPRRAREQRDAQDTRD